MKSFGHALFEPFLRVVRELVGMALFCTGLGSILAFIALGYEQVINPVLALALMAPSGILVGIGLAMPSGGSAGSFRDRLRDQRGGGWFGERN